ncbi:MAG TPA: PilZ domain-containing protein [Candidatus Angelobacter sp.]|nr:PilZ domain-containing protein [Candidatus Angelobacter sp.]
MQTSASQSTWEFLIVCRDAKVETALTQAIQSSGGATNLASDTASAMSYVAGRKLDGIFLDTRVESALNFLGSVRRGNSNRFAAVFACAGEDEDISRLLNAGANFVLHRPVDPAEIKTVLKNAAAMMMSERQRYVRHRLSVPVVLKAGEEVRRAITRNISRGGMAVQCLELLNPGSVLQFVLELPALEQVSGRGEVAWSHADGLMGIRFYLMGEEVRATLWQWMEQKPEAGQV